MGGGFAGIVTGLQVLSRDPDAGHRVTVYERGPEVSTTLCGEGLSLETLSRMMFDGFDHRPFIGETFKAAAWSIPDGKRIVVPDPCHTMDRARWIPAMAEHLESLGGTVETGKALSEGDIRHLRGDLVVGADGPGSKTRRVVGGSVETRLGIQYRVVDTELETDELLFHTDKRYSPEYSWVFPRGVDPEHGVLDNVGLLATEDRNDWQRLDRFMADWKVGGRVVKKEAYPIAFNGRGMQRGKTVLIGDAAGMTNPVTKGGMAAVVYASEILADCVRDGSVGDYEARIMGHPIMDPAFARAVEIIKTTPNDEVVRWARYLPDEVVVGPRGRGVSWGMVFRSLVGNLGRLRDFWTIYHAMARSRVYSW